VTRYATTRGPGYVTPIQRAILEFVQDYIERNSYAPTLQEIGEAVGLGNPSSASYQVKVLERKGYLRREAGRPRAMAVVTIPDGRAGDIGAGGTGEDQMAPVPLVGLVRAGDPIFVHEDLQDVIQMPKQLVGEGELIMLRVRGDSMIDAAVVDGDLVVVRKETDVENGDIVAAMIDTDAGMEATVKTLRRLNGHVWLMPHNPAYTPIDGDKADIIGKVVTVVRQLR
jgi:repressor LexA